MKKVLLADWSVLSTRIVATESSQNDENWILKVFFSPIFYDVLHREQQEDIAHGNDSTSTKLESDPLCTKKVGPTHVLDYNSESRWIQEQQEATTHCGSKFKNILTLLKEAMYSINL